jgi:hypothetical protein
MAPEGGREPLESLTLWLARGASERPQSKFTIRGSGAARLSLRRRRRAAAHGRRGNLGDDAGVGVEVTL